MVVILQEGELVPCCVYTGIELGDSHNHKELLSRTGQASKKGTREFKPSDGKGCEWCACVGSSTEKLRQWNTESEHLVYRAGETLSHQTSNSKTTNDGQKDYLLKHVMTKLEASSPPQRLSCSNYNQRACLSGKGIHQNDLRPRCASWRGSRIAVWRILPLPPTEENASSNPKLLQVCTDIYTE